MEDKLNIKSSRFLISLIFLIIINYILSTAGFIKYILCFCLLLLFSVKNKININNEIKFFYPNFIYIILGFIMYIFRFEYSNYLLKTLFLLLLPFIFALLLFSNFKKNIDKLIILQMISILFIYLFIERVPIESQYGFTFGLFIIYFLCTDVFNKKTRFFFIFFLLIIMTLFTGKRLALILSMMVIFLFLIFKKINIKKRKNFIIIILCIFSLLYIYACNNHFFDYLKINYGILVSGREYIYNLFNDYYSFSLTYFGKGLGWTFGKISSLSLAGAGNLHNDLLMVFIDLGFLGFIVWFLSFSKWFSKQKDNLCLVASILIFIYTIGNYMTDNIMIYVNYWFTAYLILFSFNNKNLNNGKEV